MNMDKKTEAKSILLHYFRTLLEVAGHELGDAQAADIENAIDYIIGAAVEEAMEAVNNLENSIDERTGGLSYSLSELKDKVRYLEHTEVYGVKNDVYGLDRRVDRVEGDIRSLENAARYR